MYMYCMNKNWRLSYLLIIIILISQNRLFAQGPEDIDSTYEDKLFITDKVLNMSLAFDIKSWKKDVAVERDYHNCTLKFWEDADTTELNVEVKARGHFRRDPMNCNFPPIKVKFDEEQVKTTIFENQKTLKMVTHCRTNKEIFEQYLIQEYLIYKLYNLLTDSSYRVRLARITYFDTGGKFEPYTTYTFFIEDTDVMAWRIGGIELDVLNVHQENTHHQQMTMQCIFQFLIGNTDWSVGVLHNIKLVSPSRSVEPVAIPYDFDWSGIINTPYSIPDPQLGIASTRIRLYRGYLRTEEELREAIQIFINKKPDIYKLYRECPYLDEKIRASDIEYIDNFYKTIEDEKIWKRLFINQCRQD